MYGPVELSSTPDGSYIAVVAHEVFLKSVGLKVPYIIVYQLKGGAWPSLSFSSELDSLTESRYQKHISLNYEALMSSNSDQLLANGLSAMISSLIIGDENTLGKMRNYIDNAATGKADLVVREILDKFNFNSRAPNSLNDISLKRIRDP